MKFYVFLDIDGVLFDWKFLKSSILNETIKKQSPISSFKPESMQALNMLLRELGKDFDPCLVISSTRRLNMEQTVKILQENGLEYRKEILKTPLSSMPSKRGLEIKKFLANVEPGDYIILDDERFDYYEHFSRDKVIKTDIYQGALSIEQVETFLASLTQNGASL